MTQTTRITEISGEDLLRAMTWYGQHSAHVERLVSKDGPSYPPSGSDCFHPELWKDAHWRWLRDKASTVS